MLKFALKVGVAATAVYYVKGEGIWKGHDESLKVYGKLNNALGPYVKQVKEQIPVELPKLSNSQRPTYVVAEYWNKGVLTTFTFVSKLPNKVSTWTKSGFDAVRNHPDVKKVVDSISEPASSPKEPAAPKK